MISILMPVKNSEIFLGECIQSILQQSYEDWELIVINDHSTDNSLKILRAYEAKDRRIKVFDNNGSGIIKALRLAYGRSDGKFITRMDSDDRMNSDKLKLLMGALDNKGRGHLAIGLVKYFAKSMLGEGYLKYAQWLNHLTRSSSNFSQIYKECSIPSPCWMVFREDLDRVGAFDTDIYPEDYDLAFRFRQAALKVAPVLEEIHYWRDHASRSSRTQEYYSDNRFTTLKVKHFKDQDYDSSKMLILWGAGSKGKKIAAALLESGIPFRWICNNPKKIGKEIYATSLEDLDVLSVQQTFQVIVAVSSPNEQAGINAIMQSNKQHQYFRFC